MKVVTLDENSKQNLLDELLKRSPNHYGEFTERVNAIIEDVKKNKDAALFSYTERFDGAKLDSSSIRVTKEEIEEAYREVDPKLLDVIKRLWSISAVTTRSSAATVGLTASRTALCLVRKSGLSPPAASMCPAARRSIRLPF